MKNDIVFYPGFFPDFILAGITTRKFGDFSNAYAINKLAMVLNIKTSEIVSLNQKHTNIIHTIDSVPVLEILTGDGLTTKTKNVLILVKTADCLPVLIADIKKKMIMALHIGRLGVEKKFLQEALTKFMKLGADSKNVKIHFGPHIKGSCYFTDLDKLILKQLRTFGIKPNQLYLKNECTKCNKDKYFSHRGGDGGRMATFIMIK